VRPEVLGKFKISPHRVSNPRALPNVLGYNTNIAFVLPPFCAGDIMISRIQRSQCFIGVHRYSK
jgi:hypothetical protein